jgi:tRNA pseudouridine32 synthase / 23S rRNA pseudouridine746 synthase
MTDDCDKFSGRFIGELVVVYADDSILAINKPVGLPTLPDGYNPDALHVKAVLAPEFGPLWIVHRLDRDTSGLLLLARNADAHRVLNTQFEKRQVAKRYHALTCGCPDWEEKTIHLPLRPDGDRRHRSVVDSHNGKRAETEFHLLERLVDYALLEAIPHTGRTHQIRAHLAAVRLPILGDELYGGQPKLIKSMLNPGHAGGIQNESALLQRCALHAHSLELTHPASGETLRLEAPYPEDFTVALQALRNYSA